MIKTNPKNTTQVTRQVSQLSTAILALILAYTFAIWITSGSTVLAGENAKYTIQFSVPFMAFGIFGIIETFIPTLAYNDSTIEEKIFALHYRKLKLEDITVVSKGEFGKINILSKDSTIIKFTPLFYQTESLKQLLSKIKFIQDTFTTIPYNIAYQISFYIPIVIMIILTFTDYANFFFIQSLNELFSLESDDMRIHQLLMYVSILWIILSRRPITAIGITRYRSFNSIYTRI
jgi:hypothetical protein